MRPTSTATLGSPILKDHRRSESRQNGADAKRAVPDSELFAAAFRWFLERHLEKLKASVFADETGQTVLLVRDATRLLDEVKRWTPVQAGLYMARHRNRRFVTCCINEARTAQHQLRAALLTDGAVKEQAA